MTKPNLFIINSDYLSIAQTSRHTYTYIVPAGTIPAGGQTTQSTDFSIPEQKGAIDHVMVKLDNGNYTLGQRFTVDFNANSGATLSAYRTSPNTLHAEVVVSNLAGASPVNYPMMTFTIKVSSFKPPNIF